MSVVSGLATVLAVQGVRPAAAEEREERGAKPAGHVLGARSAQQRGESWRGSHHQQVGSFSGVLAVKQGLCLMLVLTWFSSPTGGFIQRCTCSQTGAMSRARPDVVLITNRWVQSVVYLQSNRGYVSCSSEFVLLTLVSVEDPLPYFTDYKAIVFSSTSTHAPYNTVHQMYG